MSDNIITFPTPEELDINDEQFWQDCSEIYHMFANTSLSLMRMSVADGHEVAGALCVVALSILKGQNMTDEEIKDFTDMVFDRD
jgi:hypothetical protein|tara:strand:- start:737 stop:988 length:252 start_codon:yes stop_codon:yes gene_type:complete